ncbi:hypothetical protein C8R44DRAFT_730231 [Mycena epipterygia]|nr:hypothetical protein C8R44DRAFT_730231 [Mycena epipterygia]
MISTSSIRDAVDQNLSIFNQYECLSRQCRHPWPGVWEASGDELEKEKMSIGRAEATARSRTIVRQRESTSRKRAPEATAPRVEIPEDKVHPRAIRDFWQSGLKDDVAERCGSSPGQSSVGEVMVERKKDLESCHVDRSTADAAVELLTRKKLSKNGVYCQLSLIGRPIETLT